MARDTARDGKPIDLKSGNSTRNDQLHKSTKIQSSVTPEQYPAEDRNAQVEAATGQPAAAKVRKTGKW